jgi:hypothetical protein
MNTREIWRRITSTQYTRATEEEAARRERALEDEVARLRAETDRLRAENRALLNSILGIAGVPPIPADISTNSAELPRTTHPAPPPGPEAPPSGPGTTLRGPRGRLATGGVQVAAPLRRRSWQQINRMLEFESARKIVASDE